MDEPFIPKCVVQGGSIFNKVINVLQGDINQEIYIIL